MNLEEAMQIMSKAHEGICEAHQLGMKMSWLIRKYSYFWLTMLKDCIDYTRGVKPVR